MICLLVILGVYFVYTQHRNIAMQEELEFIQRALEHSITAEYQCLDLLVTCRLNCSHEWPHEQFAHPHTQ